MMDPPKHTHMHVHTYTAIDGLKFQLKDELNSQQYLVQVYLLPICDLFPCVLRAFSFTLQFALGELNLMSLEQVERDVNTPPSLINLNVKEGHYFFSTLWQL